VTDLQSVLESMFGKVIAAHYTDHKAPISVAASNGRAAALPGYESLAAVHDQALEQAQAGKGAERHATRGEAFEDQQIVQLGEWMSSTAFAIGQACKKAIESTRLPDDRARAELLGAINYLAAAIIVLDRRQQNEPSATAEHGVR
jgi:hypothetical protein